MSFVVPHPAIPESALLNSNDVLSDTDIALLHSHISSHRANQMALDDEIQRLESILTPLKMARYDAGRQIQALTTALHPARCIPDDVLREIFAACGTSIHEIMFDNVPHDSLQPDHTPWTLALVCKRWRVIALDTPSLWSKIGLDFVGHMGEPFQSRGADMLASQIERARKHSLTLSLYIEEGCEESIGGHQFLAQMTPGLLEQCANLRVHASAGALMCCSFLQPSSLTNIVMFTVELIGSMSTDKFARMTSLRHLVTPSKLDRQWIAPPLQKLVSYSTSWVAISSLDPLERLSRDAPSLKSLAIQCSAMQIVDFRRTSKNTILFPALEELCIEGVQSGLKAGAALIPILFNALHTPSLETLEIKCGLDPHNMKKPAPRLFPMFDINCVIPVTKLVLHLPPDLDVFKAIRGGDIGLSEFLRMTPNVTEATLKMATHAAVIQCMSALSSSWVLPMLATLNLCGPGGKSLSSEHLLKMLRERFMDRPSPKILRLEAFPMKPPFMSKASSQAWEAFVKKSGIRLL